MTKEKLSKANELQREINRIEEMLKNTKTCECETVLFTFGNHSEKKSVTTNSETIQKVRNLIVLETELELDKLKTEFNNL